MKKRTFFKILSLITCIIAFGVCNQSCSSEWDDILDDAASPRLKSSAESEVNYNYTKTIMLHGGKAKIVRKSVDRVASGSISGYIDHGWGQCSSPESTSWQIKVAVFTDIYYLPINNSNQWSKIYEITYLNTSSIRATNVSTEIYKPHKSLIRISQEPIIDIDPALEELEIKYKLNNARIGSAFCPKHNCRGPIVDDQVFYITKNI